MYFVFVFCFCCFAYLIGSFNFAILISKKVYGKEIREIGSKNAGMTNVLRSFGKLPAILTFFVDFLKGVVSLAIWFLFCCVVNKDLNSCVNYLICLCVLLGHNYPVFYNFRGGKGVLVVAGSLFLINWRVFLVVLIVFLIVFFIFKIVSLSALCSAILLPIVVFVFCYFEYISNTQIFIRCLLTTVISFVVIHAHKANIGRLFSGSEPKIGK